MTARPTYPKHVRLRRKGEFRRVLDAGEVFPGREALVRRAPNRLGHARLGLTTPRRYGNAVRRNAFRRLVREAFRLVRARLGPYDYVVSPRRGLDEPTLAGLVRDLERTETTRPAPPRSGSRPERGA